MGMTTLERFRAIENDLQTAALNATGDWSVTSADGVLCARHRDSQAAIEVTDYSCHLGHECEVQVSPTNWRGDEVWPFNLDDDMVATFLAAFLTELAVKD